MVPYAHATDARVTHAHATDVTYGVHGRGGALMVGEVHGYLQVHVPMRVLPMHMLPMRVLPMHEARP